MTDFSFVSHDELRYMIERDYRELTACLDQGLDKATLLLSGTIIEAILTDFFLTFLRQGLLDKDILDASLWQLIEWAVEDNVLSSDMKDAATVLRRGRNIIHPGIEFRLGRGVDHERASIAANLLEVVVKEIAEECWKRRGYTAEQAIARAVSDTSSEALFGVMVERMVSAERRRLFRSIPSECLRRDYEMSTLVRLIRLHELLKKEGCADLIQPELMKAYEYIHVADRRSSVLYLSFFGHDLYGFESTSRRAVIEYLLSAFVQGGEAELRRFMSFGIARHLGEYLDNASGLEAVRTTIKNRAQVDDPKGREHFVALMADVLRSVDRTSARKMIKELAKSGLRDDTSLASRIGHACGLTVNRSPTGFAPQLGTGKPVV